jgi:hypothetical protein
MLKKGCQFRRAEMLTVYEVVGGRVAPIGFVASGNTIQRL